MTNCKALTRIAASLTVLVALLAFAATPAMAEKAPFGLQSLAISETEAPAAGQEPNGMGNVLGPADVQAGSHPYALTTAFVLDKPEELPIGGGTTFVSAGKGLKDVRFEEPAGFVGNPNATPKCSYQDFDELTAGGSACPNDTAVGTATTALHVQNSISGYNDSWFNDPVYNIEPPGGVPAEFGYDVEGGAVQVLLAATVRTGSDYGITVNVRNIAQSVQVQASSVSIWGVPAEASHDPARGSCLGQDQTNSEGEPGEGKWQGAPHNDEESAYEYQLKQGHTPDVPPACPADVPVRPLLTNPTSCGETREASFSVDDWEEPGVFHTKTAAFPELLGCDKLDFSPSLSVQPDGTAGSSPTGLNVGVHVSQESTTNPDGLGEADVKDTTTVLPVGVQISPSASDGLEACTANPADPPGTPGNEIGLTGFAELRPTSEPGVQTPQFTPRLPGSVPAKFAGETEPLRPGVNFCPDASKIATVRVKTPLLEDELTGSVYLAAPQNYSALSGAPKENPFESLIAMYLVAEEPVTGVLVKLPAKVGLNEETGQITTTFENTPQTPFSNLELEFYGSARAPLATPALCGTYNTEASFVPWSGTAAVHPVTSFQITSGPNGTPCSDPLPFSPTLDSGTLNINSGSYSELTTTLGREDGQQNIRSVQLHYPAGLSGLLSGVKLCGEQQANEGTCGPESEIGESIVSVGLGNDPFTVVGGKVFITGPYEGAPFGLSIINPAKAGPYVLQEGRPVVVRAKIEVNPLTSALTVTTNPSGPYAIPHMIEGIPLNIKHVYVNINRHDFTFNPTNCTPTAVTGTINSDEGASSPVSIPLQVTNCGDLKFAPSFKVSTSGKTSKANGASLTATVTEPSNPAGQANIGRVKVELPKQLPSRLTTLQKACTNAQFELNPAGCPSASFIGHAVVHTQLLPVPLEGPAIFVSHGGEAFPSLEIVLQGDNVTIDLVGATYISPQGITSTTFKTVPDQPFETFSLTLPEGPYSALAANGNLCAPTTTKTVKKKVAVKVKGRKKTVTRKVTESVPATLTMPNEFVAQNGTVIKQTTDISVAGCAKAAPAKKAKKAKKEQGKKGKKK